ncbi:hypothetical protein [Pumilibacter intestinalis]|uniref:hypothetical protein n=1 Tax=Pumilibacter intestinalis TaxID=2941511 RepID=UPI00203AB040|nr:hypothetical protein [Pumilibacter intestinalis]
MAKPKFNLNAADITLRIHNADTLALVNELAVKLGNRSAVLNEALDIGVPIMYARIFGKAGNPESAPAPAYSPSVGREMKELRRVIDDLFIEMAIQETMIAGLFNATVAQLDGEAVNAETLRDGSLCDLPELVSGLKEDLIGMTKRSDS